MDRGVAAEAEQLTLEVSRVERGHAAAEQTPRQLPTMGLFSGVGGIELGLSRAGHPSLGLCEVDGTARAVLAHRFPDLPLHGDVAELRALPADTELLAGGFPCQDLSQAGRTAGLAGAKSGLISEVFRLVEDQRVPWLLLENVPFMLQLSKGRALDVIVTKLESLGYKWAYRVVDSRAFGLPQRRRRVLIVASLEEEPRTVLFPDDAGPATPNETADTAYGFYWTEGTRGLGWAVDAVPTLKGGSSVGVPSPPAIWMPDGRIVTPHICDAERLQGFKANWTIAAERVAAPRHRWKLVGNAVSVRVAKWVGKCLSKPRDFETHEVRRVVEGKSWPTNAWSEGGERWTAEMSEWPKRFRRPSLTEFLRHEPKPLSERATRGFLRRAENSSLRFVEGFLPAVRRHLDSVSTAT
ncbi:MAG TPA: DNA (cytosine-5-)-methyltransferase [Polyangiaceae bacterium LLY-WYZ-15_(1-7)]|nr:DNA (cytosine-5-)-methyltransferase [Polyangiaceae bacterium LLY-WYZ-15_(1-7)]HJL08586.1 DNA (cytosine-5-)-methyltransferase [Polyangiaceae bacterium LLY-WYZ-15_(1-7)]HJL28483.1 DNA (cytosine-5-)-methyltransferase [Polyangiaceae bacterium LLY-WYZ-15_(1-7)]